MLRKKEGYYSQGEISKEGELRGENFFSKGGREISDDVTRKKKRGLLVSEGNFERGEEKNFFRKGDVKFLTCHDVARKQRSVPSDQIRDTIPR